MNNTTTQNYIEFLLNEELITLYPDQPNGISSTTSVLEWLRNHQELTGTKEACGEGDCGACTVVIAEEVEGKLNYKSATSCILFLPYLNGKQLITIEHLSVEFNGKTHLHPVQTALANHQGSQCGFCTPGVVMSLFTLYKNHGIPDNIPHHLSGNLCRCTGYEGINKAAQEIPELSPMDGFSASEQEIVNRLQSIKQQGHSFETPVYYQPKTVSEALWIKKNKPELVLMGGATDIALLKNKKKQELPTLLDLSAIEELKQINAQTGYYEIGALASIEQLYLGLKDEWPDVALVLDRFGSKQIRNLATVGGNLGSASPIGDLLPLLMAHQADILIQSHKRTRTESIFNFFVDYRKTTLNPDEIITKVFIPVDPDWIFFSEKLSKRKQLDISTVVASFAIRLTRQKTIGAVILAFGGMASMPIRATETEEFLLGKPISELVFKSASKMISEELQPISDVRASATARAKMASNLLIRFFDEKIANI